ncbi:hypothetical protein [Parabacteroides pacaensis]|uniref:hypothetical protein n=1 Tax=Parabacteroides pacaensis TaxID=2086575 RepID=UPI00131AD740|nr:hypothetical protein [Parabacteroides pacaensis]
MKTSEDYHYVLLSTYPFKKVKELIMTNFSLVADLPNFVMAGNDPLSPSFKVALC